MKLKNRILITIVTFMLVTMFVYKPSRLEKLAEPPMLRDPTYEEALLFLTLDTVDSNKYIDGAYTCYNFSRDTVLSAEEYGIRCYMVIMFEENKDKGHAIVSFHTTDYGIRYFDPQTDKEVHPKDWVYG